MSEERSEPSAAEKLGESPTLEEVKKYVRETDFTSMERESRAISGKLLGEAMDESKLISAIRKICAGYNLEYKPITLGMSEQQFIDYFTELIQKTSLKQQSSLEPAQLKMQEAARDMKEMTAEMKTMMNNITVFMQGKSVPTTINKTVTRPISSGTRGLSMEAYEGFKNVGLYFKQIDGNKTLNQLITMLGPNLVHEFLESCKDIGANDSASLGNIINGYYQRRTKG